MNTGIYKIENKVSGKVYIGSASNLRSRFAQHNLQLRKNIHYNEKLQNAWNKYGADAFEFSTLLFCTKENLLMYEQLCIDGFDAVKSGYNIEIVAGSFFLGRKHKPETIAKLAASSTGRKHTAESKTKIAESNRRRVVTKETGRKISESNVGRKHSEESKRKITNSLLLRGGKPWLGKTFSKEHLENLAKAAKGRRASPETRARMSASLKGRVFSKEHLEKILQAQKSRRARERAALCT